MPLVVIGAGFGRTGTTSLQQALEVLLGGKVHHMNQIRGVPGDKERHFQLWEALARGEKVDFEELFQGYIGAVDWPSCNEWKALAASYPDAKVILSMRDVTSWHKSVLDTIYISEYLAFDSFGCSILRPINSVLLPQITRFARWSHAYIWERCFYKDGPVRSMRGEAGLALAKKRMLEWNDEVVQTIGQDRLLIFDVKEGWEPLCQLLGKPVPDVPFPRSNDTAHFQHMVRHRKLLWYGAPLLALSACVGTAVVVAKYLKAI